LDSELSGIVQFLGNKTILAGCVTSAVANLWRNLCEYGAVSGFVHPWLSHFRVRVQSLFFTSANIGNYQQSLAKPRLAEREGLRHPAIFFIFFGRIYPDLVEFSRIYSKCPRKQ
jgi:hypothetical protein